MDARAGVESRARDGAEPVAARPGAHRGEWTAGTDGNEQLTATVGVALIILLAALGITIVSIGQLIWLHLFLGLLLIGPIALKIGSTGYRFARYYTRNPEYLRKGPPFVALRLIAPIVMATTVIVFATGVVLLFNGPAHRSTWLLAHKASFIVWLGATAVHVLGHLPGLPASLRAAPLLPGVGADSDGRDLAAGAAARWILLAGAIVGGVVLAIVLIPHFGVWTAPGALHHHS
jgi:hypothetical protein